MNQLNFKFVIFKFSVLWLRKGKNNFYHITLFLERTKIYFCLSLLSLLELSNKPSTCGTKIFKYVTVLKIHSYPDFWSFSCNNKTVLYFLNYFIEFLFFMSLKNVFNQPVCIFQMNVRWYQNH